MAVTSPCSRRTRKNGETLTKYSVSILSLRSIHICEKHLSANLGLRSKVSEPRGPSNK